MIEKKSPVPVYYQVKTDIEEKIKHDYYKIGEQLPTDFEFCNIYNVSRITIRRALLELESTGYIERIQGKGTFVKFKDIKQNLTRFYSFTEEIIKMGYVPSAIFLKLELLVPDQEIQKLLGLKDGEQTYLLERLRLADEMIVAYDRSYIPEKIIPGFRKEMIREGSLYKALKDNYGFAPNNSEETIEAISINANDAAKMRVKAGTPELLVKRVSYFNDKKIEFNYRIVNSTLYKYKLKLD